MKTLRDVRIGQTVKVVKLHGEGPVKRRIMDMGITKGTEVFVRSASGRPDGGHRARLRAEPAQGGYRNDRSGIKRVINFCRSVQALEPEGA